METTGEKGFHRNIKTSRKGGVSSFHVMPLSKKGPPSSVLLLLVSQKKKKERKGKENLVGFDRFLSKDRGIILLRFPAILCFFPVFRGPTINNIPKSDARARSVGRGVWNENKRDFEPY